MRLAFFRLLALTLLATPLSAMASSFTDFPLTIGGTSPFERGDGPCPNYVSQRTCVETLMGGQISGNAIGTSSPSTSPVTVFDFDISPDWSLSNMQSPGGSPDNGVGSQNGPIPPLFSDWGYGFTSTLTLCSTEDVCSSSTSPVVKQGGAVVLTVSFAAQAGGDTGVYQTLLFLNNVQVLPDPQAPANLDPVPEPSTFALVFTGVAVVFGAVRRRVSKR